MTRHRRSALLKPASWKIISYQDPHLLKTACVVPRLKKKSLDPDELSSYRPIPNLPFLSKTLERAVAAELNTYLTDSSLFSSLHTFTCC